MPASPNVLNYAVLKGRAYWTPAGGVERPLGNAPRIEITPDITKLEHFSSMEGVGLKDANITQRIQASIAFDLDEITIDNLALALFGSVYENSDGDPEFAIMSESTVEGSLRVEGTNDVGNRFRATVDKVSITPSEAIPFISEEVAVLTIEGECLKVAGAAGFGLVTEIRDAPTT
jgi:hypothetical protein